MAVAAIQLLLTGTFRLAACDLTAAKPAITGSADSASPEIRGKALLSCPVGSTGGAAAPCRWLHLDALVPRVIHRAQGHGGRVDRVPDLYRPLAGVEVGLVDGLVRIDHRQSDRTAEGEPVGRGADVA